MKMTLKALRVNAGLTQQEAADKIGVFIGTLRSYESGKTSPDPVVIGKMCDLYGMTFDDINFLVEG